MKRILLMVMIICANNLWAQNGLIGYWSFDNTLDDSVGTAHGIFSDGNPTYVSGRFGNAILLDGVNDHVVLGNNTDLNFGTTTDFSVALWVKTDGWNEDASIMSNKDWDSGSNTGWVIAGGGGSSTWQWNYSGAEGGRVDFDPTEPKLDDGLWHHLCVTHDRDGKAKCYFDGIIQDERDISSSSGTIDANFPTVVGTDGAEGSVWAYWFAGAVDELKIFNDVLSQSEVDDLAEKPVHPSLAGHWTFDNTSDLLKGELGADLTLTGTHIIAAGPEKKNGAIQIGVGSYYTLTHGIAHNGGGNNVNEFTLVFDVKVSALGNWFCFYQTNMSNSNDGECFINPSGKIGVGATGYSEALIKPNEWYRIAVAVDNGNSCNYYIDGTLALEGIKGSVDARFSLDQNVLLFADNNGEDNAINVADIKIYSSALNENEISELGGFSHTPPGEHAITDIYLQSATPTSIYVCWHSAAGNESIVAYGTTEALGNTDVGDRHVFDSNTIWHWVKLTDLTPETIYYYKMITENVESEIYKFKTPPVNGSNNGHIRFGVVGDNRTEPEYCSMVNTNMKAKMIELWGENIEENVNVLLNVGDIVSTGTVLSQYKTEFFQPYSNISANIPLMVSIGNHEIEAEHYYNYMKYEDFGGPQGEKYYSFQLARILFVAINSNYSLRNDTQIAWLDTLLDSAEKDDTIDWVFAFCHHPGRSEVWPDGNTTYIQDRVIPTLTKYSKAEFLMYGHSHNYERGAAIKGNLGLMLSGGGGSALDRWRMYGNQRDYPEIQRSFDHYCYALFDIDIANRSYVCETYSLGTKDMFRDNELIDSFSRKQVGITAPDKPTTAAVADTIELPFTFEASGYSSSEPIGSSQFQFTNVQGDYSEPAVDVKRDFENIYYDTGAPDYLPIDLNEGINLSQMTLTTDQLYWSGKYFWRMRYRNRNLQWSDWSDEKIVYIKHPGYKPVLAYNKSFNFDGLESYIRIEDNLNNVVIPIQNMTVETWVKVNSTTTWGGYIGAVQDNGSYEKGWVLGNYNQSFSFALSSVGASDGDGSLSYLSAESTFDNGKWYHVAGTYNGTTMRLYVNGQLEKTTTVQNGNILYDMASYFSIGAYHDDNEFFVLDGQLDEIRLWDTALSQSQIQDWMHNEMNETHPEIDNLISYWNFNNMKGDSLFDFTNNHLGIIKNQKITSMAASTAPVGLQGSFIKRTVPVSTGLEGTQITVTITSTPSNENFIGVYQSGKNDGSSVDYETFPPDIYYRSNIYWGIAEYGNVTADIELLYQNVVNIAHPDSLTVLQRTDAMKEWTDVTNMFSHIQSEKKFTISGISEFGEYSLGWKNKLVSNVRQNTKKMPEHYELFQNYPNPFNPTTQIKFAIKKNECVQLEIFNVNGQKIKTLVDGIKESGYHIIDWNASDLSSGIYFYRLKTASFVDMKKCIIVK
jgi:hypothetical protein